MEKPEVCLLFLTKVSLAVFMVTGVQQRVCPLHRYRLVLPRVGAAPGKAVLRLRPSLVRKSITRITQPLHLPHLLLQGWVVQETAERQQNQHVRRGC